MLFLKAKPLLDLQIFLKIGLKRCLTLFLTLQVGLLGANSDHFRTKISKKVRIRTKVRKNQTIWEHCVSEGLLYS